MMLAASLCSWTDDLANTVLAGGNLGVADLSKLPSEAFPVENELHS